MTIAQIAFTILAVLIIVLPCFMISAYIISRYKAGKVKKHGPVHHPLHPADLMTRYQEPTLKNRYERVRLK